jgi:hypothetical protein
VGYPRFRKTWWAYRRNYHAHVRDELVFCTLKENCLAATVKALLGDMEELDKVWEMLDTCYNHPQKYIAEALEPSSSKGIWPSRMLLSVNFTPC